MKIDQIAIKPKMMDRAKNALKFIFGVEDWQQDDVICLGQVVDSKNELNMSELQFNYELMDMEFELIQGTSGHAYHDNMGYGIVHVGIHIDDPIEFKDAISRIREKYVVIQDVMTMAHTNENIKDTRRYRYVIFDTTTDLGVCTKLIHRLDLDGKPYMSTADRKIAELDKKIQHHFNIASELKLKKESIIAHGC